MTRRLDETLVDHCLSLTSRHAMDRRSMHPKLLLFISCLIGTVSASQAIARPQFGPTTQSAQAAPAGVSPVARGRRLLGYVPWREVHRNSVHGALYGTGILAAASLGGLGLGWLAKDRSVATVIGGGWGLVAALIGTGIYGHVVHGNRVPLKLSIVFIVGVWIVFSTSAGASAARVFSKR